MSLGLLTALAGTAVVLLLLLVVLLVVMANGRRRIREALEAARADVEQLRARLDVMTAELEAARTAAAAAPAVPPEEFVITTAGEAADGPHSRASNRAVLSVTMGEPLLKAVAFGYGVRRALSPESRNRIAFEMRREVRRARKQRRRDIRQARRTAQTAQRETPQGEAAA
jgi:Sec-independent protein translocase protein TatA